MKKAQSKELLGSVKLSISFGILLFLKTDSESSTSGGSNQEKFAEGFVSVEQVRRSIQSDCAAWLQTRLDKNSSCLSLLWHSGPALTFFGQRCWTWEDAGSGDQGALRPLLVQGEVSGDPASSHTSLCSQAFVR